MTENRMQLGLSAVLFAGTVWYAVYMASYPSNAGRVPLIVAVVMGAALVVQMVGQLRTRCVPDEEPDAVPAQQQAAKDTDDLLATAEQRAHEVEEAASGFNALLALDNVRRTRLIAIVAFSVLFYVGALMAGFVVTTGVLITAFMLIARERAWLSVLTGVLCSAAVYALVVVVLGLPALDGYFF